MNKLEVIPAFPVIEHINRDEIEIASVMFAEIFKNDLFYLTILRKNKDFARILQQYFKIAISLSVANKHAFQVNSYLGGALFFPPGTTKISILRQLILLPKMLHMFPEGQFFKTLYALNDLQNEQPNEPHFYLCIFGRKDCLSSQHQGIGRAVLTPTLNLCDQLGFSCYAEFTSEKSAELGEQLGFNIIKEKKFLYSKNLILRLGIRPPRV